MKKDLALTALNRALVGHKIGASISGKGNCDDNAMGRYIDGFYNPVSRPTRLYPSTLLASPIRPSIGGTRVPFPPRVPTASAAADVADAPSGPANLPFSPQNS